MNWIDYLSFIETDNYMRFSVLSIGLEIFEKQKKRTGETLKISLYYLVLILF